MRRHSAIAFSLFLFLALILLVSCSDAQKSYDKGDYRAVITKIDKKKNPTAWDYLLKARSYIHLGEESRASESVFMYLMLDTEPSDDRAFAVSWFLKLNTSDKLSVMALNSSDGTEAMKVLYAAYCREGEPDKASEILETLSKTLPFTDYLSLMLETPVDIPRIIDTFAAWYGTVTDGEKGTYITLLERFSSTAPIQEADAKRLLSLTDILMNDNYYLNNEIQLSVLLKTKGNILDLLYDKVNARIYWTQALKLNPDDTELKDKIR